MVWTEYDSFPDFFAFLNQRRISKWPHPQTNRIKVDFRMVLGEGLPFPRPDRYQMIMYDVPGAPNLHAYPVIDLDVAGPFHLQGSSGVNVDGREVILDVIQHEGTTFPGSPFPGIEYAFTFKKVGKDDWHARYFFGHDGVPGDTADIIMDVTDNTAIHPVVVILEPLGGLDVDWPAPLQTLITNWAALSRCYDVPEAGPVEGFAEFNGVDAYIGLDHITTNTRQAFMCSADIRLHTVGTHAIFGHDTSNRMFGPEDADLRWVQRDFPSPGFPPVETWFNLRQELEWSDPTVLTWKTFIDDVEVLDIVANRTTPGFQNLGVRRRTGSVTWGNFDMRNLLYHTGTPAAPVVQLDMPLLVNALDLSPDMNHGTTHNMDLPSV